MGLRDRFEAYLRRLSLIPTAERCPILNSESFGVLLMLLYPPRVERFLLAVSTCSPDLSQLVTRARGRSWGTSRDSFCEGAAALWLLGLAGMVSCPIVT